MSELIRTIPENEGVSSKVLLEMYEQIKKLELPVDALIMMRNGKVVTEGYWHPYSKEMNHIIYSVSKSITALAIGFLIDEGKLHLDDKFVSFFPELVTGPLHEYSASRTIENLLSMRDGLAGDPNNTIDRGYCDWLKSYVNATPWVKPGTLFGYSSAGTIGLCAVVEKVSGMRMMEYLEPRLFKPLGIENIYCEEHMGTETGSRGIHCKAQDLAKIGQMMLDGGKYNGQQVVPEFWVKACTTMHSEVGSFSGPTDGVHGYGYQWWQWRDGGWGCKGVGGQYIAFWPDTNVVLVTLANMEDQAGSPTEMASIVIPYIQRSVVADNKIEDDGEAYQQLLEAEKKLEHFVPRCLDHKSTQEELIVNKRYDAARNIIQLNDFVINKTEKGLKFDLSFGVDRTHWIFEAGWNSWLEQRITFTDDDGWARYVWRNENLLEVIIPLKEKLGCYYLNFYCDNNEISLDFYPVGWRDFNRNIKFTGMAYHNELNK